jgi:hypothetical protein
MGRDCGAFGQPLDERRSAPLLNGHGTGRRQFVDCRFRDLAAALVALDLGLGGRSRVAMA